MIDVKQATKRAIQFLREMYDEKLCTDIQLEEVELKDLPFSRNETGTSDSPSRRWLITLSFRRPVSSETLKVSEEIGVKLPREYKTFEIDGQTGEVYAMRIREVG